MQFVSMSAPVDVYGQNWWFIKSVFAAMPEGALVGALVDGRRLLDSNWLQDLENSLVSCLWPA